MSEFITIAEFMQRYSISRSQVYRLAGKQNFRIYKVGNASRIKVSEAEKWANNLPAFEGGLK